MAGRDRPQLGAGRDRYSGSQKAAHNRWIDPRLVPGRADLGNFGLEGLCRDPVLFPGRVSRDSHRSGGERSSGNSREAIGGPRPRKRLGIGANSSCCALWEFWSAPVLIPLEPRQISDCQVSECCCCLGYVASLSTKLSDTCASEVGKAYGKRTFLITTLKPVPRGTEGAVSLEGTIAGIVASIALALVGWAVGLISPVGIGFCVFAAFRGHQCGKRDRRNPANAL